MVLLDLELPVRQAFHALHEQVRCQSSARSCKDWHAAQQRTNTMQQGPCSGVQASMHTGSGQAPAQQLVSNALQQLSAVACCLLSQHDHEACNT